MADILIVIPGIYMLLKMYNMLKNTVLLDDEWCDKFLQVESKQISQLHHPCYDQPLCYTEKNLSAGISVHLKLPQFTLENYRNEFPLSSTLYFGVPRSL